MHTATHPPVPPVPPVPVLTGLGQALRWLRERQARKQYQVAAAAGITKGMLSAYETGRQRPSLETLDKLLETLGCDLNDVHNALQIVNGRPEQMKGWRGATEAAAPWPDSPAGGIPGLGGAPAHDARGAFGPGRLSGSGPSAFPPMSPIPPTTAPSWPSWPSPQATPSWPSPQASEIHEPTGGREGLGGLALPAVSVLHQVLGLHASVDSVDSVASFDSPQGSQAAGLNPPLPPEEELALAQMLEGFHNLLRYWHRCLTLLAAARASVPANLPSPPEHPGTGGGAAAAAGGSEEEGSAAPLHPPPLRPPPAGAARPGHHKEGGGQDKSDRDEGDEKGSHEKRAGQEKMGDQRKRP